MWGSYRIVYTTLMAPLYSLGDHLWITRSAGLILHMCNASLLFYIARRLDWKSPTAFVVFVLYLFFPYSLEAVAWPSNVTQYPFAPFLMLSGAALLLSRNTSEVKIVAGALLLGGSVWIHEQVGPLIILLLGVAALGLPKQYRLTAVILTLALVVANFALIFATRSSNLRLTGANAGTLHNAIQHLSYAPQLLRTTPLGDFYYSIAGLPTSRALWAAAILVGVLVGVAATRGRRDSATSVEGRDWIEPKTKWLLPLIFIMSVGAYVVSLIPLLMTPIPWHTARTVYIPFLAFTFATGSAIEMFSRWRPLSIATALPVSVVAIAVTIWSAAALRAEANAFDFQTRFNNQRVLALNDRIGKEIVLGKTFVVVSGYYDGDNERPLFGEHFIGLTPSDINAGLQLNVNTPPEYPKVFSQGHWNHVCSTEQGRLRFIAPDAATQRIAAGADRIIFASWSDRDWHIQRGADSNERFSFPPQILQCSGD